MKKWLTGLLSGSPAEKKTGKKEMPKSKPVAKAAAKPATKAAKPAAKAKPEAKPKAEPKAKVEAPAKVAKAKPAPAAEKTAPVAEAKPAKKPKKGAKNAEPIMTAGGLVDSSTPENKKKWFELREKFSKEKAAPYIMSAQFEANQPLEHKVLGWGYIVTNNNDRLEVLFETGVKILISNYRS